MDKLLQKIKNYDLNKIGLIGCHSINSLLYMFLNTFMVAYFITLTNYDYKQISIYYIMSFIFILLSFLALGRIVKNKTQVIIYRIGIIMYCLYILLIALLKEKIIYYYIYLGGFYGIVQGFFWASGHSLTNEYAKDDTNDFISLKSIIGKTLKIILPFILGISIELTSFSKVAKIILIFSLLELSFSFLIKDSDKINSKKYSLKKYINHIKNNKKFKQFYGIIACDGIVSYLLDTIITILIVINFKTMISLGALTTIFSICSILSVYIFQRKLGNNNKILITSAILMVLSVVLLLFDINKITIVIYNLIDSVFLVLLINNVETKRYEVVNNDKTVINDYLVEHQVLSEVALNISRIIGYTILFIASLYNNTLIFKILLIISMLIIIIYCYLMVKLGENKINEKSEVIKCE